MARTRRKDFRGHVVRDGQWPYRCADGARCTYCGPAAVAATMERQARRVAAEQVAEYP